jgi:hypothetical protein
MESSNVWPGGPSSACNMFQGPMSSVTTADGGSHILFQV